MVGSQRHIVEKLVLVRLHFITNFDGFLMVGFSVLTVCVSPSAALAVSALSAIAHNAHKINSFRILLYFSKFNKIRFKVIRISVTC